MTCPGSAACSRSLAILPPLAGVTGQPYLHPDALAAGFKTAVLISAGLCAAGGLLAAVTITNPRSGRPEHPRPRNACTAASTRHHLYPALAKQLARKCSTSGARPTEAVSEADR